MSSGLKMVVAVLLGLIMAIVVMMYLQAKEAQYLGQGLRTRLWVASRDIPEGERIREEMIHVIEVPDLVGVKQPGSFEEKDKEQIVGKYAVVPIKSNEQLMKTKLVETPEQSLATIMKTWPNSRTVTLPVGGADASVASMLRPGDYVDIIGLFNYNIGGRKVEEIRYFEQYVQLVALDQQTGYGRKLQSQQTGQETVGALQYGTITLAVTPENALRLILGSKLGKFYLTLRPADDEGKKLPLTPLRSEDVLGNDIPIWREADERQQFLPPELLRNLGTAVNR